MECIIRVLRRIFRREPGRVAPSDFADSAETRPDTPPCKGGCCWWLLKGKRITDTSILKRPVKTAKACTDLLRKADVKVDDEERSRTPSLKSADDHYDRELENQLLTADGRLVEHIHDFVPLMVVPESDRMVELERDVPDARVPRNTTPISWSKFAHVRDVPSRSQAMRDQYHQPYPTQQRRRRRHTA